ncbi:hypothetical protein EYR40_001823 [Pleurotus pulmonarius]|nr:hypothetical protein EYR40_001823 [Pleurotus pulmonarius]
MANLIIGCSLPRKPRPPVKKPPSPSAPKSQRASLYTESPTSTRHSMIPSSMSPISLARKLSPASLVRSLGSDSN